MSFLSDLSGLVRLARQNAQALDAAAETYENDGTLKDVLEGFAATTSHGVDDGLVDSAMASLGLLTNTLHNTADQLATLGMYFAALSDTVGSIATRAAATQTDPLKSVLEDD